MAHFAQLNDENVVTQVIVVTNECAPDEKTGQEFISSIGLEGRWLQTSYNTYGGVHKEGGTPFRKNYAGIGSIYDPIRDAFYEPKPVTGNWVFNENTCLWEEVPTETNK